jgi:Fe-S cluster biosynthesis and repair protein YggX
VESGDVEMTDAKKQQRVLKFCMQPGNVGSEIYEIMSNILL